ncbi:MAG: DUF4114 domain-containing protein [Phormidesmis sp.]
MANYNETNQGDLSNDFKNPTAIALSTGSNIITGKTTNSPLDRDFFTFTVPDNGSRVRNILLKGYSAPGGQDAYFAGDTGNQITQASGGDIGSAIPSDADNFIVSELIDTAQLDQDLLALNGGPGQLGAGTYTVWYQETGNPTDYQFDVQLEGVIAPPGESTASKLLTSDNNLVKVDLGDDDANAFQFSIDSLNLSDVSEFQLFKTDGDGNVLGGGPVETFSLLASVPELAGLSPKFTVEGLADNEYWQIAMVNPGGTTIATPTLINDREVALDFGNSNLFTLKLDKFDIGLATDALQKNSNGDEFIDLSSENGTVTATFSVFREADFNNTVGFYVANENGDVIDPLTGLTISPGESGYKEAALAQRLDTTLSGVNGQETIVGNVTLEAGGFLGMFLAVDTADLTSGDVFFSFAGANSDGKDHVKALGDNTFGFEDLVGLGDADFNDMTVNLSFA